MLFVLDGLGHAKNRKPRAGRSGAVGIFRSARGGREPRAQSARTRKACVGREGFGAELTVRSVRKPRTATIARVALFHPLPQVRERSLGRGRVVFGGDELFVQALEILFEGCVFASEGLRFGRIAPFALGGFLLQTTHFAFELREILFEFQKVALALRAIRSQGEVHLRRLVGRTARRGFGRIDARNGSDRKKRRREDREGPEALLTRAKRGVRKGRRFRAAAPTAEKAAQALGEGEPRCGIRIGHGIRVDGMLGRISHA